MYHFRVHSISDYASVSTENSVFIFGGYDQWSNSDSENFSSLIVEFTNDKWFEAGRMPYPRVGHGAISFNKLSMMIGGESIDSL